MYDNLIQNCNGLLWSMDSNGGGAAIWGPSHLKNKLKMSWGTTMTQNDTLEAPGQDVERKKPDTSVCAV